MQLLSEFEPAIRYGSGVGGLRKLADLAEINLSQSRISASIDGLTGPTLKQKPVSLSAMNPIPS